MARKTLRRTIGALGLLAATVVPVLIADAEPHSSTPVQILAVRVGTGANTEVYITVASATVCNSQSFDFPLDTGGQGMLSVAMTALSTGRSVTVEASNATGCTPEAGAGPALQSLTLLAPGYAGPY